MNAYRETFWRRRERRWCFLELEHMQWKTHTQHDSAPPEEKMIAGSNFTTRNLESHRCPVLLQCTLKHFPRPGLNPFLSTLKSSSLSATSFPGPIPCVWHRASMLRLQPRCPFSVGCINTTAGNIYQWGFEDEGMYSTTPSAVN
jgi:hypothetical protein